MAGGSESCSSVTLARLSNNSQLEFRCLGVTGTYGDTRDLAL